ncbi:MAG: hypothetical protein A2275_03035 [Bacteroidetes bacterium RIFOXYA12_FULL_35_11]|nr:MAG: hypothetical protein A2X01_15545 [Bacteroidetes bacterium GWF2_35_48]OFY77761.1 MAG: hypothetical protein A2275_03035 [Bacteroidetes bacterium RIFOXYA12_FULL_35_11]OFY94358.1 MAG: hypothetical protein A2491_00595 [Bacteroidetes bacterium RIFOXYC12_FULL_35_7]OFY97030.1 MAG: hypothetical protein A2309_07935 [Bacteroidetes bacterium RIFOXYB2_FULL_35_7]HBX49862.1 hypothetical protein [Bacteroidales bacterium]
MSKLFRKILEYTWLVIAVLSVIAAVHKTYRQGFSESYPFYIITFIAVLMFFFRRYTRKNNSQ